VLHPAPFQANAALGGNVSRLQGCNCVKQSLYIVGGHVAHDTGSNNAA